MTHVILKTVQFLFFKKLKQIETISKEIVYYIDLAYLLCLLAKIYCLWKLWGEGKKKERKGGLTELVIL